MSKKSAAHQKKVKSAMWILQNTTGVCIPQAMILAGFLKSDVASKTMHQVVRHHLQKKQSKVCAGQPQGGCWPESWGEHNRSNIFLFFQSTYSASSSHFIAIANATSLLASSSSSVCL
jgi:hypothetical protein